MLFSSRLLVLLAASATALNLGAPVLRSTRPTLRRVRTGRFAPPVARKGAAMRAARRTSCGGAVVRSRLQKVFRPTCGYFQSSC